MINQIAKKLRIDAHSLKTVSVVIVSSLIAGINTQLALLMSGVIALIILSSMPGLLFSLFVAAAVLGGVLPALYLPILGQVGLIWPNILGPVAVVSHVWHRDKRPRVWLWNLSLTLMLLFVLWACLTLFWVTDIRDGIVRAIAWCFLLLFYALFTDVLSNPVIRDRTMRVLSTTGWALVGLGIATLLQLGNGGAMERVRLAGTNPNSFASQLVFCTLGVFWFLDQTKKGSGRGRAHLGVGTIYLSLALLLIAYGGSRGEALAVLAFVFLLSLHGQVPKLRFTALALLLGVLIHLTGILDTLLFRFASDDTLGGRTDLWQISWRLFQKHPVFGLGIGGTQAALGLDAGSGSGKSPHNALLLILVDTGLPGLALYSGMLLVPIWRFVSALYKVWRHSRVSISYRHWLFAASFVAYMLSWVKSGGAQHAIGLYLLLGLMTALTAELSVLLESVQDSRR